MANDHPLLTYIEDPFSQGDILGYKKIVTRFKETKVMIGIKNWFGSDL
jgi:L-alanine-DL-glutamate epimerase-like enolase superfamily enzyme